MASAEASELFSCSPEEFFKIIADYERYPEFLNEVKKCTILKTEKNRKLVQFDVALIKSFSYALWLTEEPHRKIFWTLDHGDLFKISEGSWTLREENGKTHAHYQVKAEFRMFLPGPIAKGLVSVNLPNMMNSYAKRVRELYGS